MSPMEQMKVYIKEHICEYTEEFISFVEGTISSFNDFYPKDPNPITVVSVLYFNTQKMKYERGSISSKDGYYSQMEIAKKLSHQMLGQIHPLYCVGYCVAADGLVSQYDVKSDEEREEALKMAEELRENDPLAKEMLIYTISSILGIKKMDFFEVVRGDKVVIRPHVLKGLSNDYNVGGPLSEIFETTEVVYKNLAKVGLDISSYIKKNIFE